MAKTRVRVNNATIGVVDCTNIKNIGNFALKFSFFKIGKTLFILHEQVFVMFVSSDGDGKHEDPCLGT